MGMLILLTFINYHCVAWMSRTGHRKFFLIIGLLFNIYALVYYKYIAFLVENLNFIKLYMGIGEPDRVPAAINPVGVSFITFQAMSYLIDVYRGHTRAQTGSMWSYINVSVYIAFFPQLVAGPIERSHHLLKQFLKRRNVKFLRIRQGAYLFAVGLMLKMGIADVISPIVDYHFNHLEGLKFSAIYIATVGFAIQIFCDFAGYTFMARGVAKCFGFTLNINFRQPYLANSFSDFWRRWHISLSSWVRDYLYIPLGGSRGSGIRTSVNLITVMLVMGLWHGASWNFALWGLFHGVCLVLERVGKGMGFIKSWALSRTAQYIYWIILSQAILFSWFLFRIEDLGQLHYLSSAVGDAGFGDHPEFWYAVVLFGLFVLIHEVPCFIKNRQIYLYELKPVHQVAISFILISGILAAGPNPGAPFIYFQF